MSPDLLFWFGFVLKMVLTAAVVVITSVAVERSGPFVGALIGALPTAAGAAYTILALEHPPDFHRRERHRQRRHQRGGCDLRRDLRDAGATSRPDCQPRRRRRAVVCDRGGVALVDWTPLSAVAINVGDLCRHHSVELALSRQRRAGEIRAHPLRYSAARAHGCALVVAIVTAASSSIGSFASGMFALFPIILGSSIVIMHPRIGGKATASMLAHAQLPLIGLALGFLVVHYLVAPIGVWPALGVGLVVCLAWSGSLLVIRMRQQKRSEAISASQAAP